MHSLKDSLVSQCWTLCLSGFITVSALRFYFFSPASFLASFFSSFFIPLKGHEVKTKRVGLKKREPGPAFDGRCVVSPKRTKKQPVTTSFIPPAALPLSAVSFGAPVFVCSQSPGEGVDLAGLDTKPLGFPRSTKRPADLLSISSSPTHYFSSYLPLVFPSPGPYLASFPSRPANSILAGVIDFSKGRLPLPSRTAFPSFWLIVFPEQSVFSLAKKRKLSQLHSDFHPLTSVSLTSFSSTRPNCPDRDGMSSCQLCECI